MSGNLRFSILLTALILLAFSGLVSVRAQVSTISVVPTESNAVKKEKGSTLRGRVLYQDTNLPVRHGWVGFRKIRELLEPQKNEDSGSKITLDVVSDGGNNGASKYALTNDNGEFVIKNIEAGIYQPVMKVAGILNPTSSDRENPEFQQIAVDGLSDLQTDVVVRRGAAISGRIFYADGEPIIGAKVQVYKKVDGIIQSYTYANQGNDFREILTDDRGFYRFSGLPAGEYIVRVTEQAQHNVSDEGVSYYNLSGISGGSELKTYYPNVSDSKEAQAVPLNLGVEQPGIDITVPNHKLFQVSGKVIAKKSKLPLKNVRVAFQKINDNKTIYYSSNGQLNSDEKGDWFFKDLPNGKYRITLSPDTTEYYGAGQPKTDNQPKYASVYREIELTDGNLTDVIVELPLEATISGTVTVEGNKAFPELVYFFASDPEKKLQSIGYSTNQGKRENTSANQDEPRTFKIKGLSEGNFLLTAQTDDYYVKSIRLGNKDLLNTPFQINDGDQIEGVQVVLGTDVGTLKGQISNYRKDQSTFVMMVPPGSSFHEVFRNAEQSSVSLNGQFELKAGPGEYLVFIGTLDNLPDRDNLDEWYRNLIKDAQRVTIRSNETTTITLNLPD